MIAYRSYGLEVILIGLRITISIRIGTVLECSCIYQRMATLTARRMKHKLIIEGLMQAKCSCGLWQYIGIMPEANRAIKQVHHYHASFGKTPKTPKKVKKTKKR